MTSVAFAAVRNYDSEETVEGDEGGFYERGEG